MKMKPSVQLGWMASKPDTMQELQWTDDADFMQIPIGAKFYFVPPTHRIVSVKLLERLFAHLDRTHGHTTKKTLRKIIDQGQL